MRRNLFPATKGGERQDTRDLLLELRGNGFDIVRTRTDLEAVPAWRRSKVFGLFSNNDLAYANQVEERGQQPSLSDMVRRAIQLLQYNAGGYLLVVDAGLMRKAAEAKQWGANSDANARARPRGWRRPKLWWPKIYNHCVR